MSRTNLTPLGISLNNFDALSVRKQTAAVNVQPECHLTPLKIVMLIQSLIRSRMEGAGNCESKSLFADMVNSNDK